MKHELIIDGFAGGGGASTGIHMALGRSPDIAINHDAVAVAMHTANHPDTEHHCQNIWRAIPAEVVKGRKVGLAWFSPDCKHFSKAKGGKPVKKNIRDLAWVVVAWARLPRRLRPRVIVVENVEEFVTWGPLGEDSRPCIKRGGLYFRKWARELRKLGYQVDWRELVAADYGSPTIRKRLFVIARNDKQPIVWPEHTHGKPGLLPVTAGKLLPWRTAAEIIDWSIPCPSIFDTSAEIMAKHGVRSIRPLAPNTLARVARGVKRYVIDAAEPFIVPITHTGDERVHGMGEPMRTVMTAHRGEHALITPFVAPVKTWGGGGNGARDIGLPMRTTTTSKGGEHAVIAPVIVKNYHGDKPHFPVTEPARTILTGQHHMLVAPCLAPRYLEKEGQQPRVRGADEPAATITSRGNAPGMLVAPMLSRQFGASVGSGADEPAPTVMPGGGGKTAVVAAFLAQHNTDMVGHEAREPVSTIVQKGCTQAVVSAGLVNMKGTERRGASAEDPAPTQTAGGWHIAEVQAFLLKYYGADQDPRLEEPLHTVTSKDRFGLCTVMIGGEPWAIVDIGMRMLTPRELFRAQGFPDSYVINRTADGTPITKTDQIRMCGNSVCPQVAAAIVGANYVPLVGEETTEPEDFRLVAAE